jgi:glycosyltransferase involved in cell wall biosynthesis
MKLTVMIPTVPGRFDNYLPRILKQFNDQIAALNTNEVELLVLYDNKKRSIGEKRNALLQIAQGDFVVYIDDDDRVSDDYLDVILNVINAQPDADCIVYDCLCVIDEGQGRVERMCKYGIEFDYWTSPDGTQWTGKPAHTMIYKASLAKSHLFADMGQGEDVDWVKRACLDIKKQVRINNKVMYFYEFDGRKSER